MQTILISLIFVDMSGNKPFFIWAGVGFMKKTSSLRSIKTRHPDCQVVRRKGSVYVICKTNPRYKAKQG